MHIDEHEPKLKKLDIGAMPVYNYPQMGIAPLPDAIQNIEERKPAMEMEYEDPNDILYEMFGVDNDEDLDEALDSWSND